MPFAQQAALALANARAHRKEQRAGADLEALVETCPVGVLVLDAAGGLPLSLKRGARPILVGWNWSLSRTKHALRVLAQLTSGRDVAIECDGLHPELRREVGDGRVTALHRGLRKANLGLGQGELPPSPSTSCAGGGEAGDGALANELAFKLGERRKDPEDESTCWSGGVDLRALPCQDPKPDLPVRELLDDVDEVAEVSSEAVELPDDERVLRAKRLKARVEPRAAIALARRLVLVDRLRRDARGDERIALGVEALGAIGLRDACVTNQHVS